MILQNEDFLCFPSCGENVGKENGKPLVERTLRGFCVSGAEALLLLYIEVQIDLIA